MDFRHASIFRHVILIFCIFSVFHRLLRRPKRCAPKFYAKSRLNFCVSSVLDPIGDRNDVAICRYLPLFAAICRYPPLINTKISSRRRQPKHRQTLQKKQLGKSQSATVRTLTAAWVFPDSNVAYVFKYVYTCIRVHIFLVFLCI